MYHSRAGLVALVFILIISLVSALPVPIPAAQFELSSTLSSRSNRNGQGLIQHNTAGVPQVPLVHGSISTSPSANTGSTPVDEENQLVRRNIFSKIKAGFQKMWHGIKHVAQKIGSGIKHVAQKIGSGIKHAAQKVGSGIKKVAQKIGSGIKRVAQKVGSGIKKVARKIGTGIKTAAKKVWHFVKTTGAKIAKVALKVVSVVTEAVGKVAGFIPGIGKPLGKALEGESKLTGFASDKIHANIGGKLGKAMRGMDKAEKVMGYIPRRRDLSEEESFQQRDIHYLEERDDIPLEYREEYYMDADVRDIYERALDYYLDWE